MSDERKEGIAEAAEELRRHLLWLSDAGVREVPRAVPGAAAAPGAAASRDHGATPARRAEALAPSPPPEWAAPAASATPSARPPPIQAPSATPSAPWAGEPPYAPSDAGCGSDALLAIRSELGECARCKLGPQRTKLVFGVGAPAAELMFVGEGPGEDEDLKGEPFVGRAGQLLTKMIEAMGFRRDEVYIANVVKCRPPGNRNPEPDEIAACEPFLRAQIAAIRPKVIVALGKFAVQTLLRDPSPIGRLRGRWFEYGGVRLMPTFHPAYLLRSPGEKGKAWEDLQLVMKELGRPAQKGR